MDLPETVLRRSKREVKLKKSYSPETTKKNIKEKMKVKKHNTSFGASIHNQSATSFENLTHCHYCSMPLMQKQAMKGRKKLKSLGQTRWGSEKGESQTIMSCSFCRNTFKNQKSRMKKNIPSNEAKEAYLREAENFALSLADTLKDSDAKRLFCPEFKMQPCGCLQKWILGEANGEMSYKRAQHLLSLLKEAKSLSLLKCYDIQEVQTQYQRGLHNRIGVGNGHKKSMQFEKFVLLQRHNLKREMHMCERACQKVLMYSNNFLHKRLKTEPEKIRRVHRSKGKSALGLLIPITDLPTQYCCKNHCALMASTHKVLLEHWRQRTSSGQAEARRVIAEMLTPSGLTVSCFKFISWVTGSSFSTISKVQCQMYATGGDREPPEHGLKKYWQEQLKVIPSTGNSAIEPLAEYTCDNSSFAQSIRPRVATRTVLHTSTLDERINKVPRNPTVVSKRTRYRKQKNISETQTITASIGDSNLLNSNLQNMILVQPSSETNGATSSLSDHACTPSTNVELTQCSTNPQINGTVTTWSFTSLPGDNGIGLPQNVIFSFSHMPKENIQQEENLLDI